MIDGARVVARPRNALPRVHQAASRGKRGKPQHGHVRVRHDPVGEVHRLVHRHLRLHRSLEADDQVEVGARGHEAQARVFRDHAGAPQRQQQVGHHDDHVHAEQCRGGDGRNLRRHGNDREHVVVRAVQGIQEEQQPEPEHRQEVAVDGPARRRRDDKVDDRQRHGRHKQAHRIVNPQAAECGPAGARHEFGHDVAHRVGQQREHEAADDVPARHVKVLKPPREERRQELHRRHQQGHDDDGVDHEGKFGPLQRLAHACQHQHPPRQHHREVPHGEQPAAQGGARDRPAAQDGHGMVEEREERVPQPAEHDALRVRIAQASPTEPGNACAKVGIEQLKGDDDAEGDREEQGHQGGDPVRVHQGGVHPGHGAGMCGFGHRT